LGYRERDKPARPGHSQYKHTQGKIAIRPGRSQQYLLAFGKLSTPVGAQIGSLEHEGIAQLLVKQIQINLSLVE